MSSRVHASMSVLDPATGKTYTVRLSKVTPTAGLQSGNNVLCLGFLDYHGCVGGSNCAFVHVGKREHIWERITTMIAPDGMYLPGFTIQCYDITMTRYLNVPSQQVMKTAGSESYVAQYNESGDNFRAKFNLCRPFVVEGACPKGDTCKDIHCTAPDLNFLRSVETHIKDEAFLRIVPTLPAALIVRVYAQNSSEEFEDFPGDRVLQTIGSKTYMDAATAEGNRVPSTRKMQHCAHFRLKKVCRVGARCRFLHVIPPPDPDRSLDSGMDSLAFSRSISPTSDQSNEAVGRTPGDVAALFVSSLAGGSKPQELPTAAERASPPIPQGKSPPLSTIVRRHEPYKSPDPSPLSPPSHLTVPTPPTPC